MPTYTYKAVADTGQTVNGSLQADNRQVALRMLDEQSLFPVSVDEGGTGRSRVLGGKQRKVKLRYLTVFYSQLSDLLTAGVPILRALEVLANPRTNATLAEIIKEVREHVAGGSTLADALGRHPTVFRDLHVAMIRAGERGGFLEEVLNRIAGFVERQDELRNKLAGAMIYPCLLLFAGTMVVLFLLTVVVPKLRKHLREENFNLMTVIVFGMCDLLLDHWVLLIGGAAMVLFGVSAFLRTDRGRDLGERVKLSAPVIGPIVTMVVMCRFCRILGTLLENGVPILQALRISKDSAGNVILANEIDKAADNVKKGESLSRPLGSSGLFPPEIIDMIAVAEESNTLDQVLVRIADTNEARTARLIDLGVRIVEPVLLVFMAGMVFCIAVALLLPILTMGSTAMR